MTEVVDTIATDSAMICVLLDGFPIHGPQGEGGKIVKNADLDACSGHLGKTPEFPGGICHFHLTTEQAPYSIDCYHGVVDASLTREMWPGRPPPDFAAIAKKLGVSHYALMDALGSERPPNLEVAAQKLGMSVNELRDAMGPPPGS